MSGGSELESRQYCESCKTFKLADHAKFRKVDGRFHVVCRACEKEEKRKSILEEKREKLRQIMAMAASSVLKANTIPHPAEMLSAIIEQSGGIQQFAIDFHLSRMACEPGTMARKEYDKAILKLVETNAEMGGARKPIDSMELSEIGEELEAHLEEVSRKAEAQFLLTDEEEEFVPDE